MVIRLTRADPFALRQFRTTMCWPQVNFVRTVRAALGLNPQAELRLGMWVACLVKFPIPTLSLTLKMLCMLTLLAGPVAVLRLVTVSFSLRLGCRRCTV